MLYASARFWLLDFFGHVVDHDPLRDCLFSITPPPGRYPGLFFFADNVLLAEFTVTLRKVVSLPMPIPQLLATRLPNGVVTLRRMDGTGRYLRSVENEGIDFQAIQAKDWEHFFILSEPMMHAYAILSQDSVSTITNEQGEVQAPLRLVQGHNGQIGDSVFSLATNLSAIEDVASLGAGAAATLVLSTRSGDRVTFQVTRS